MRAWGSMTSAGRSDSYTSCSAPSAGLSLWCPIECRSLVRLTFIGSRGEHQLKDETLLVLGEEDSPTGDGSAAYVFAVTKRDGWHWKRFHT